MKIRSIILAATITVLVAVLAMWARSFWRMDVVSQVRDDGSTRAIASYQGAIHLAATGTNGRSRPRQWDVYHIPRGATYATLHRVGAVQWKYMGFARVQTSATVIVSVPGTNRLITVAVPPGGTLLAPFGPTEVSPLLPWL